MNLSVSPLAIVSTLLLCAPLAGEARSIQLGQEGARALFPGRYEAITRADAKEELLRALAENPALPDDVRPLLTASPRVYRRALSCYPMDFYLIDQPHAERHIQAGLLISRSDPREVIFLNGDPAIYHQLNDRGLLTLSTREQADEYARLLLNTIGDRTSVLHIAEKWGDIYWITPQNPKYSRYLKFPDIGKRFVPMELRASEEPGGWIATVNVSRSNIFFRVALQITPKGDFRFLELNQDPNRYETLYRSCYEGHLYIISPKLPAREYLPHDTDPSLINKEERHARFLKVWEKFPLLEINQRADEPAKWYEAVVHLRPVRVGKYYYSGFRFRYAPEEPLDFVWGYFSSRASSGYNLSPKDSPTTIFETRGFGPLIEVDRRGTSSVHSHTLGRDRLVQGQEYLLWFGPYAYVPEPFQFTFALRNLKPPSPDFPDLQFDARSITQGLGLDWMGNLGLLTDTGEETGLILAVGPMSPASRAGLQPGDRVLSVTDTPEPKIERKERIKDLGEQRFQRKLKWLREEGRTEPDEELVDLVNPPAKYVFVTYERLVPRFPSFLLGPKMREYSIILRRQKESIVSGPKEFTPLTRMP